MKFGFSGSNWDVSILGKRLSPFLGSVMLVLILLLKRYDALGTVVRDDDDMTGHSTESLGIFSSC